MIALEGVASFSSGIFLVWVVWTDCIPVTRNFQWLELLLNRFVHFNTICCFVSRLVSSTAGFQNILICENEYVVIQELHLKIWEKAPACKYRSTRDSVQCNPKERFMISFKTGHHLTDLLTDSTKMKFFHCCLLCFKSSTSCHNHTTKATSNHFYFNSGFSTAIHPTSCVTCEKQNLAILYCTTKEIWNEIMPLVLL